MLARPRLFLLLAGASLGLVPWGGCGGDPPPEQSTVIEGPYALVVGSRASILPLAPGKARVVCQHRPGMKEFGFEGTAEGDASRYLRFTIKDYTGPKSYELEYKAGGLEHKVEAGFPAEPPGSKSYRYRFFEYLRIDLNVTYRSHCDFSIAAEELQDRTRFTGTVSCGALWADFDSLDYLLQPLNAFADLVARFECEQAT